MHAPLMLPVPCDVCMSASRIHRVGCLTDWRKRSTSALWFWLHVVRIPPLGHVVTRVPHQRSHTGLMNNACVCMLCAGAGDVHLWGA
jgi:hypothetical protein